MSRRVAHPVRLLLLFAVAAGAGAPDLFAAIEKLGGDVGYDYQFPPGEWRNVLDVDSTWDQDLSAELPGPKWLRELIGDEYFMRVYSVVIFDGPVSDDELKLIGKLADLRELIVFESEVTDAGLGELYGLKELRTLELGATEITDSGVKRLQALPKLETLDFSGSAITDRGVLELRHLTSIDLSSTSITDEGLRNLQHLKSLRSVILMPPQQNSWVNFGSGRAPRA